MTGYILIDYLIYIRAGNSVRAFLMFEHARTVRTCSNIKKLEHVRTLEPVRTFERARPFKLFEHQKGSIRLEIMAGKNARAFQY